MGTFTEDLKRDFKAIGNFVKDTCHVVYGLGAIALFFLTIFGGTAVIVTLFLNITGVFGAIWLVVFLVAPKYSMPSSVYDHMEKKYAKENR